MSHRIDSLDAWKGLAIVAVVAIHATTPAAGFPPGSQAELTAFALRQVLNFAVALFFGIAGYRSPSASALQERGVGAYYRTRLVRLWIPYLVWTVLYLGWRRPEALLSPVSMAKYLLLGGGVGIGYFIVVLSCLMLLHPYLSRVTSGGRAWAVVLGPSMVTLAALYYLRLEQPGSWMATFPYMVLPFTLWMGFFQAGYLLRHGSWGRWVERQPAGWWIGAVCAGLVFNVVEGLWLRSMGFAEFASSQVRFSNFLFSAAVLLLAARWAQVPVHLPSLSWLGRRSLVIYLAHLLVLGYVERALRRLPALAEVPWLGIALATGLTLGVLVVAILACERWLSPALQEAVLGQAVRRPEGPSRQPVPALGSCAERAPASGAISSQNAREIRSTGLEIAEEIGKRGSNR